VTYVLTHADLVWNRALSGDSGSGNSGSGMGDRHLHALAAPYGRIMSGGVSSVLDICTAEQVRQAADAFAYLGLADLAGLTRRLVDADWDEEGLELRLNHAFYGLECAVAGAFERKYAESPQDFDAVAPDGIERRQGSWSLERGDDGPGVCLGELIVHENAVVCSLGDDHPSPGPSTLHSRSSLHSGTACELCPSGPTWAGQTDHAGK